MRRTIAVCIGAAIAVVIYGMLAGCATSATLQDACPPGMTCILMEPLELLPETPVERFERECDETSVDSGRNRGHGPWRYCA